MSTPLDTIEIVREFAVWKETRTLQNKSATVDDYEEHLEVQSLRKAVKKIEALTLRAHQRTDGEPALQSIFEIARAALEATVALEPQPLPTFVSMRDAS